MKIIIVAMDKNRGIGDGNDLLWGRSLPKDLELFKKHTINTAVIMGRKTYESIGRPLPNRQNIVLSRKKVDIPGCTVCHSIDEAYKKANNSIVSIIGGGEIYKLTINDVNFIYATEVKHTFPDASVFFPELDPNTWQETDRKTYIADENNLYDFDLIKFKNLKRQ